MHTMGEEMTARRDKNRWKKINSAKQPYLTQIGQNELECGVTDVKLISLTLTFHHVLTYVPASSNCFRCSYIKFPKSDLEFVQKLCFSPFCLKIYKSSLSLKDQLKCHLLQKASPRLPTAALMSVLSILSFFLNNLSVSLL